MKQEYTLNCDCCGRPYNSKEAFPSPQLCPACKDELTPEEQEIKEFIIEQGWILSDGQMKSMIAGHKVWAAKSHKQDDCPRCEGKGKHLILGTTSSMERCSACNGTGKVLKHRLDRPNIICLCGSSKFIESFAVLSWEFEKAGNICLGLHYLPPSYSKEHIPDHLAESEDVAKQMDELHRRKIDLANEVFVINVNGYIGESTSREIAYATKLGKPIKYLEDING